ncbi:MAG TPA: ABC-three component system middle component 1 [Chryseobacterium sp.]
MESFEKIRENQDITIQIKKNFDVQEVIVGDLIFGSIIPIVLVQFKNFNDLEKCWKDFNSLITAEYLIKLTDDFSKWNSYIFFITEKIPKSLKYEIENNKFSTRKIVIEMGKPVITDKLIDIIISEHIVNDDINLNIENTEVGGFSKNELISVFLDNLIKENTKKLEDSTLTELLTKIEKGLDNEN